MEEENSQEWKDLRARVDALSNSVFVIAGGAITLSASAVMNAKVSQQISIVAKIKDDAIITWSLLLFSIFLFILLKCHLVLQAYARMQNLSFYSNVNATNKIGWGIGLLGLACFFFGLAMLVYISSKVLNA